MVISIEFRDGRVKEFNTQSLTASDPWRCGLEGAKAIVTEFDLRCDLLDFGYDGKAGDGAPSEGLRLDVYYDTLGEKDHASAVVDELRTRSALANHWLAGSITLASPQEMEAASIVTCESCGHAEVVAWRQGPGNWLISGGRFRSMARTCYTDANTTSTNSQAVNIANYLSKASPDLAEEEVARAMGFPYEAYVDVLAAEAAARLDAYPTEGDAGERDAGAEEFDPEANIPSEEIDLDQEFEEED